MTAALAVLAWRVVQVPVKAILSAVFDVAFYEEGDEAFMLVSCNGREPRGWRRWE